MLRERARIGCISDNRFCPLLRESLLPLWVAPHHMHVLSLCDQSFCYYASSVPCGPCNHVHRFLLADRLRLISFSVGMRVRVPRMRGASVYRDSYKARMPDRPGGLSEWRHPPEARSDASQIGGTLGGRAMFGTLPRVVEQTSLGVESDAIVRTGRDHADLSRVPRSGESAPSASEFEELHGVEAADLLLFFFGSVIEHVIDQLERVLVVRDG